MDNNLRDILNLINEALNKMMARVARLELYALLDKPQLRMLHLEKEAAEKESILDDIKKDAVHRMDELRHHSEE